MVEMTEEARKEAAEALKYSEQFDVHIWSHYPEVNNAVDNIYNALKKGSGFKGSEKLRKKHVKVVILDLYVKWLTNPAKYSSYHRRKIRYTDLNSRYNKLNISYLTIDIVDALTKLGYTENIKGHFGRDGKRSSHIARMRATPKLIDLIVKTHKVTPEMVEKFPNTECIIMRDLITVQDAGGKRIKKKVDIPYVDTDDTNRMRRELYAYNNLLRRTFFDIQNFPKAGALSRTEKKRIKYNPNDKFVRRIFNNATWDDGGRFYGGWWQRLSKDWRQRIMFGGSTSIEIDYSGLHITILYALKGIDYWKEVNKDPYQIEGYERSERLRSLLKKILLVSINDKTKESTIKTIRWEIITNDEYEWVKDTDIEIETLIDQFAKTHAPIESYFFSGYGVKLQKIDSMMAEYIINYMTQEEKPVLCVHDSFIVSTHDENLLQNLMREAFNMIVSSYADFDKDSEAKVSKIGVGIDKYNHYKLLASKALIEDEEDIRDWALTSIGNLNPSVKDWDFDRRFQDHMSTEWDKEFYHEGEVNVEV